MGTPAAERVFLASRRLFENEGDGAAGSELPEHVIAKPPETTGV